MSKAERVARVLDANEEQAVIGDLSESVMIARLEDWISQQ